VNDFVVRVVVDATTMSVAGADDGEMDSPVQELLGGGEGESVSPPSVALRGGVTGSPSGVSTVVVQYGEHGSAHGPASPRLFRDKDSDFLTIRSLVHAPQTPEARQVMRP
jgi:hypothetical protein